MITVKRQLALIDKEDDNSEIVFSSGKTVIGVIRHLLNKCNPEALINGWSVIGNGYINGVSVIEDDNERIYYGNSRKYKRDKIS